MEQVDEADRRADGNGASDAEPELPIGLDARTLSRR
jgi:hypothetical protein